MRPLPPRCERLAGIRWGAIRNALASLLALAALDLTTAAGSAAEESSPEAAPSGVRVLDEVAIDVADNAVLGDEAAPVTVVEFLDFECGFCAEHVAETVPKLEESYIAAGKVRYVELDMPLTQIHRRAFAAARAAYCAGRQASYWPMRDRLLKPGAQLEKWDAHAAALGLDAAAFDDCLVGRASASAVRADAAQAARLRVPGTPTLVVARTDPDNPRRVLGLSMLAGRKEWSLVEEAIEAALRTLPPSTTEPPMAAETGSAGDPDGAPTAEPASGESAADGERR